MTFGEYSQGDSCRLNLIYPATDRMVHNDDDLRTPIHRITSRERPYGETQTPGPTPGAAPDPTQVGIPGHGSMAECPYRTGANHIRGQHWQPVEHQTLRQVVSDRMDLVATRGQEMVAIGAKAARPSEAHVVQVMLYMLFLQLQGPALRA